MKAKRRHSATEGKRQKNTAVEKMITGRTLYMTFPLPRPTIARPTIARALPSLAAFALAVVIALGSAGAHAAPRQMTLIIKDHRFEPAELRIPAGEKIRLIVHNQDPTPEEFESYELKREKVIGGGRKAIIFIGPLKPGSYPFFGEFNPETAQGRIIAE